MNCMSTCVVTKIQFASRPAFVSRPPNTALRHDSFVVGPTIRDTTESIQVIYHTLSMDTDVPTFPLYKVCIQCKDSWHDNLLVSTEFLPSDYLAT